MVTASQLQILQSPITGLISSVSTSMTVKLDDTNYLQWHFQMKLMLEGYGIMDFVNGTNPCPSQFMSPSSCDSGVASSGSELGIESDAYKLKSDLQTIKKEADSVTQYLQRIKEARDYLAAAGVMFADEDIVILALNGLPAEYNIFRCVIRGRENVISLKEFRAQLLVEEALIENTSTTPFLFAMVVKNSDMDHNVVASSGFHGNSKVHGSSGYNGFSGQPNFYNGGNLSKFKGKGKAFNNQG
ncbi:uncharacterized protein [Malus domestica]|uniref:uncharacterized protein n=1 Tax=Malus domestica TaxID=3750 RepID=UPI003974D6B4